MGVWDSVNYYWSNFVFRTYVGDKGEMIEWIFG